MIKRLLRRLLRRAPRGFALACLLALSCLAGASITLQQTKTGSYASTNAPTKTWTSNTTTGDVNCVFVVMRGTTPNVSSITDSQGNSYSQIDTETTGGATSELWRAENITGGTTPTVTVNISTGAGTASGVIMMREYSGLATVSVLDKHVAATGAANPASSGATAATTVASELVIGACATFTGVTLTAGAGYGNLVILDDGTSYVALEDKTVSSTGAQTATFVFADTVLAWSCFVATFKTTVTAVRHGFLLLMGAGGG